MKKNKNLHLIYFLFAAIFFVGCNNTHEEISVKKEMLNILGIKDTPYYKLLDSQTEVIGRYVFTDMHLFMDKDEDSYYIRNNSFRVYPFSDCAERAINVTDRCDIQNTGLETQFHLSRTLSFDDDSVGVSAAEAAVELTIPYEITIVNTDPIRFIRPYSTLCDPTPLCYYEDMEIEWNPDPNNANGVVIVIEWLGGTAFDDPVDESLVNGTIVDDTGTTILSNDLFDGIPDNALVNMYLMRANIAEFGTDDPETVYNTVLGLIRCNPDSIDVDSFDRSLLNFSNPIVINGSVALLPIVLIREL